MTLNNHVVLIITISSLLSTFSSEAYFYIPPSSQPSPPELPPVSTPTPAPLSYISSSPYASPAPSLSSIPLDEQSQISHFIETNLIAVHQKAEEFIGEKIKKRLNDFSSESSSNLECLKTCDEVYGNALDDIMNGLDSLSSGNLYKARFDISALSTNVDTCDQCFREIAGEDPDFKEFDEWVMDVVDDCLAKLERFRD